MRSTIGSARGPSDYHQRDDRDDRDDRDVDNADDCGVNDDDSLHLLSFASC